MARQVIEVFISSTAGDLERYRDAVHIALMDTGLFFCISQKTMTACDAAAEAFCRRKAAAADLFVGLVGMRRGWEPNGDKTKRSITEIEHDVARESGRRRYIWVTPDEFPVPGNDPEPRAKHARQLAFRKRVMAGGERIVSQKDFDSPEHLASAIIAHLLKEVVSGDLIRLLRPELVANATSVDEQGPAIAAAVEKLAEDKDVDLLALARDPQGVDIADLEAKLTARAETHEAAGQRENKNSAQYWRHIGALEFLHNTQKALAAYQKATALDPNEPEALRYLGELQYRLGDMAAAERSFTSVVARGTDTNDRQVKSLGLMRLGWINRSRGDLEKAEHATTEAARLAESIGWSEGLARAYGGLGNIHFRRNDLDKAEEMHRKALALDETLGSIDGLARTYGNLGNIHSRRGDFVKAEEMYDKSLALNEELGRKEGMATAYGNLGNTHFRRGDLDKAEEMHRQALALDEELGHKEGVARHNWNLALIHEQRRDKPRLCACLSHARDLRREIGLEKDAAEAEAWMKRAGCSG